MRRSVIAGVAYGVFGDVPADLVENLPGMDPTDFRVYSGYLTVEGPLVGYDSLSIHYQFNLAQKEAATSPVVAWHQGGPGGSSVQGEYVEMGYFRIDDEIKVNPHAWNRVANMLYLESPAGSGESAGFSQCIKNGKPVACKWNDVTQAVAYSHTLLAFFEAFPEFKKNKFYLAGESYFGQYGPNIADYILSNEGFSSINLAGMLVGNGCWGGTATSFDCNGPNAQRNDLDAVYGKGMVSKKSYTAAYEACGFNSNWRNSSMTKTCESALHEVDREVGPHNIYNVYDNCPGIDEYLTRSGKSMAWVREQMRAGLAPGSREEVHKGLLRASGGYPYDCSNFGNVAKYFKRKDVQEALHLREPGLSSFHYDTSGPASVTLYPKLVKQLRILIFNGDADMCVPYNGNEEWISDFENRGILEQADPWRPWFSDETKDTPAGSKITYSVVGSNQVLTFMTIRLAGHMVPQFRPAAALTMFSDFVLGTDQAGEVVV